MEKHSTMSLSFAIWAAEKVKVLQEALSGTANIGGYIGYDDEFFGMYVSFCFTPTLGGTDFFMRIDSIEWEKNKPEKGAIDELFYCRLNNAMRNFVGTPVRVEKIRNGLRALLKKENALWDVNEV